MIEKIEYLYHASPIGDITTLQPYAKSIRDVSEGPVIFASSNLAYASMFLNKTDDSWTIKSCFSGVFYHIISDKDRFLKSDKGGYIYKISSEDFEYDPNKGMGKYEYIGRKPTKVINQEYYKSSLSAMLGFGVKVYFVDKDIFIQIKEAHDHGLSILSSVEPYILE